jgi:hypothetical protein
VSSLCWLQGEAVAGRLAAASAAARWLAAAGSSAAACAEAVRLVAAAASDYPRGVLDLAGGCHDGLLAQAAAAMDESCFRACVLGLLGGGEASEQQQVAGRQQQARRGSAFGSSSNMGSRRLHSAAEGGGSDRSEWAETEAETGTCGSSCAGAAAAGSEGLGLVCLVMQAQATLELLQQKQHHHHHQKEHQQQQDSTTTTTTTTSPSKLLPFSTALLSSPGFHAAVQQHLQRPLLSSPLTAALLHVLRKAVAACGPSSAAVATFCRGSMPRLLLQAFSMRAAVQGGGRGARQALTSSVKSLLVLLNRLVECSVVVGPEASLAAAHSARPLQLYSIAEQKQLPEQMQKQQQLPEQQLLWPLRLELARGGYVAAMLQLLASSTCGIFSLEMLPLVNRLAACMPGGCTAADERQLQRLPQVSAYQRCCWHP